LYLGSVGDEANVPTQQPEAKEDARLPGQDAHDGRPERPQATPLEGAKADRRLKGPSRARFEELYSTGQRANGDTYRIHALPGSGLVGIATQRKIGNTPRRNRQRRRTREALVGIETGGLDIAVTVKPEAREQSIDELREELRRLVAELRKRWADGSASD
jgi:ribonuclease P protein component